MQTRELPLDAPPWEFFRALARMQRPFFIDAGQQWGNERVSCMGFHPRMQFRVSANEASAATTLDRLDAVLDDVAPPARERAVPRPVPFAGGVVVALSYECKNVIERLPQTQPEAPDSPRLVCALYDAVVAYEHRSRRWMVASWHLDAAALARYADEVLEALVEAPARRGAEGGARREGSASVVMDLDASEHAERVAAIQRYIAAGDVYQVNLTQSCRVPLRGTPLDLYGRLRALQPAPFGGYFDLGHEHALSNSPELFLRRRGDHVVTCPIKGTRPRGTTTREDTAMVRQLHEDPKERAEHLMIVDLERNDLGRVCRTGTVHVPRFQEILTLATVHHLVSTVGGRLNPGTSTGDLLRATFPSGSVTGAPKIRALEIIDELERGPRGFYTGALGWIDASGDCDLNVAIRTAIAADGMLSYHVGGGIVADSKAEREYAECWLKARALLDALEDDPASPLGAGSRAAHHAS